MQFILIYASKCFWGLMGAARAPWGGQAVAPPSGGRGVAHKKLDLGSRKCRGHRRGRPWPRAGGRGIFWAAFSKLVKSHPTPHPPAPAAAGQARGSAHRLEACWAGPSPRAPGPWAQWPSPTLPPTPWQGSGAGSQAQRQPALRLGRLPCWEAFLRPARSSWPRVDLVPASAVWEGHPAQTLRTYPGRVCSTRA